MEDRIKELENTVQKMRDWAVKVNNRLEILEEITLPNKKEYDHVVEQR